MLVLVIWKFSTIAASFLLFVALGSSSIMNREKQVLKCNEMRDAEGKESSTTAARSWEYVFGYNRNIN